MRGSGLKLKWSLCPCGLQPGTEWQIIFYGASGVERFRGTNVGQLWDTAEGVPEVFEEHMRGYRAHALGISGGQEPCSLLLVPASKGGGFTRGASCLGWGGGFTLGQ